MRKEYVRPTMVGEKFVANEYVAACWKINCNVPYGFGFVDNNGNGKYDERTDKYIARGSGCNEVHVGVESDNGPVANAMWQPTGTFGGNRGDAYPVFWFQTGRGNNDQHFSKVEDAEWETNPNAS